MKTEHLSGILPLLAGIFNNMKINALPRGPQEGSRSPGTVVTDLWEQSCGFKELNLVLSEKSECSS